MLGILLLFVVIHCFLFIKAIHALDLLVSPRNFKLLYILLVAVDLFSRLRPRLADLITVRILFHVLALHRDLASVPRLQALLQVRDRVMALLQFLL